MNEREVFLFSKKRFIFKYDNLSEVYVSNLISNSKNEKYFYVLCFI
jgi:hypothetical protein